MPPFVRGGQTPVIPQFIKGSQTPLKLEHLGKRPVNTRNLLEQQKILMTSQKGQTAATREQKKSG